MQIEQLQKGFAISWLPEQWRDYRLLRLTGRLPAELADTPAWDLDWLLAIDDIVRGDSG